jgi:hypothetical protein
MIDFLTIQGLINFFVVYVVGRHVIAPFLAKKIVTFVENSDSRFRTFVEHYRLHGGELQADGQVICTQGRCTHL